MYFGVYTVSDQPYCKIPFIRLKTIFVIGYANLKWLVNFPEFSSILLPYFRSFSFRLTAFQGLRPKDNFLPLLAMHSVSRGKPVSWNYLVYVVESIKVCVPNAVFFLDGKWIQKISVQFSLVTQSCLTLCDPMNCSMPASLSTTNSQSLLKLTSIESVMPSSHLILCRPLLLLPPIPSSIRVFSNESTLLMRWPKYWSFSFSIIPSKEHPGLISFGMTGWISSQSKGLSRVLSSTTVQKHQFFGAQLSSQPNSHIC